MIDAKKVSMMTRIAIYEQGEGKKDKIIHRYSKSVYMGIRRLVRFLALTIAYILAAGLYGFRYVDDIFSKGFAYDYKPLLIKLLIGYFIVLVGGMLIMEQTGRRRYKRMLANLKQYDYDLFRLERYMDGRSSDEQVK